MQPIGRKQRTLICLYELTIAVFKNHWIDTSKFYLILFRSAFPKDFSVNYLQYSSVAFFASQKSAMDIKEEEFHIFRKI